MSRLEQKLNNPRVVLIVGVIAVALNVLLYFGLFVPRMTPLVANINPVGSSLLEAISNSGRETGSNPQAASRSEAGNNPEADSVASPEAGSNPQAGSEAGPHASGKSGTETGGKSGSKGSLGSETDSPPADSTSGSSPNSLKTHPPAHLLRPRLLRLLRRLSRLRRLSPLPAHFPNFRLLLSPLLSASSVLFSALSAAVLSSKPR